MTQQVYTLLDLETGQVHPVLPSGTRVGRVSNNDIVVDSPRVSRNHATLWQQEGALYVRDESSTNGTWINEERLSRPTSLAPGDRVRVGNRSFAVQAIAAEAPPAAVESVFEPMGGFPLVPILILGGTALLLGVGLIFRQTRSAAQAVEPTTLPPATEISVPTPTLTFVPTPTAEPGPTTPPATTGGGAPVAVQRPAPSLLEPADGLSFTSPPTLVWSDVGPLGDDEYYRVIVDYPHEGEVWREVGWTKGTRWMIPEYLSLLLSGPYDCRWHVEVVRATDFDDAGNPVAGESTGLSSETWTVYWKPSQEAPSDAGDSGSEDDRG